MRLPLLIVLVALVLVSSTAGMSRKEMIDMQTARLTAPLQLTEVQTDSVRAIITRSLGKLQQLTGDRREARQAFDDLDRAVRAQISVQLTEDQRPRLAGLAEPVLPDMQMFSLNDQLNLTKTQYDQIARIRLVYRERMNSLRGSGGGDREASREQMQELMAAQDAEIEQVLTEEQRTEYRRLKSEQQQQRRRPDGPRGDRQGPPPGGGGHRPR